MLYICRRIYKNKINTHNHLKIRKFPLSDEIHVLIEDFVYSREFENNTRISRLIYLSLSKTSYLRMVWYIGGGRRRRSTPSSKPSKRRHITQLSPPRHKHRWKQNKLWMGPLVVGRLSGRAQHPLHSADCREPLSRQLPTSSGSAAGWLPSTFIVCDESEKVHPGKCELCVLMAKNGKWYAYFTVRAKYPYF